MQCCSNSSISVLSASLFFTAMPSLPLSTSKPVNFIAQISQQITQKLRRRVIMSLNISTTTSQCIHACVLSSSWVLNTPGNLSGRFPWRIAAALLLRLVRHRILTIWHRRPRFTRFLTSPYAAGKRGSTRRPRQGGICRRPPPAPPSAALRRPLSSASGRTLTLCSRTSYQVWVESNRAGRPSQVNDPSL